MPLKVSHEDQCEKICNRNSKESGDDDEEECQQCRDQNRDKQLNIFSLELFTDCETQRLRDGTIPVVDTGVV